MTELRPVPSIAAGDAAEAIRRETMFVAWTALAFGLVALAYCVRHGTLLLYGDAVAHLHIARRVFDSITPGLPPAGVCLAAPAAHSSFAFCVEYGLVA